MTTHTHHLIARDRDERPTEYLNVSGSWHRHPALATPFFELASAATACGWVQRVERMVPGTRYGVVTVSTAVNELPAMIATSSSRE